MMIVATALALVMAIVSAINDRPELWRGPPDEAAHRGAASYYVDHWLPPRVGDPATLGSYSLDYGFSYINDPDLVYFFAGKFARVISPIVPNHEHGFRLFNVFLLGLLTLCCALRPERWLLFVPLVISPQVWYIFSYFNGDGFAIFLTVIVAWQVADPRSGFNRFLDEPRLARGWPGALLLAIALGLLFLSKKNYYAFLAFVPTAITAARLGAPAALMLGAFAMTAAGWYLGWFTLNRATAACLAAGASVAILAVALAPERTNPARARIVVKLAILGLVCLAVAAPRYLWDAKLHGSLEGKRVEIVKLQEKIARLEYKPSIIEELKPQTFYGLGLRAKGVPLKDLFAFPWNWHVKIFSSATGVYGWLQFNGPVPYYVLIAIAYAALFAAYATTALRSRDTYATTSFVLASAFSALIVAVALYTSWNDDFQAQGRYLFPIVGMLGIGLHAASSWVATKPFSAAIAACFALSLYSFLFIGLVQVQKAF
jgi:hypothetical protein